MGTTYEIWCGGRLIAFQNTRLSRLKALAEYLRSAGCRDDEVVRLDRSAACWQGAVYRAVPLGSMESSPAAVAGWTTQTAAA